MNRYKALSLPEIFEILSCIPALGLSSSQVAERHNQYGYNHIDLDAKEPLHRKFLAQFQNPLIMLLLASATVSSLIGHYEDSISIGLTITIVLTVAFIQEYQSEKSIEALNKLAPNMCAVIRNGEIIDELASELVVGDIIRLQNGCRIPADARLVTSFELDVDESSLTGETNTIRKHVDGNSVSDGTNMVHMGTLLRSGYGTAIVVAIGSETEIGAVFKLVQQTEKPRTPLQNSMDDLGKQLSFVSFAVIAVIGLLGIAQSRNWLDVFTISVSLAVAAIPEGLPIVVTVTLALGVIRLARKKIIIKTLPCVESLGHINVICMDKTGTITLNKMTATSIYTYGDKSILSPDCLMRPTFAISRLMRISNLCNNASYDDIGKIHGNPTEVAILELHKSFNLPDERLTSIRNSEQMFTHESKFMTVGVTLNNQSLYYSKGALEILLPKCTHILQHQKQELLNDGIITELEHTEGLISRTGARVIAFAYGNTSDGLCFVGLMGMIDPPRKGMDTAIMQLRSAGIKFAMVTGDSYGTATAIAEQVGISTSKSSPLGMSGFEIDNLSEAQLAERINSIQIFWRTTPTHKLAIVRAFQSREFIVAMTGDGVNDAPALRMADVGICMGGGTDVAKEAADLILVENDFSTLTQAVEEGKAIFGNIRNFLKFQLSTSISALILIAVTTVFGYDNPLNAMQILWINIICDGPVAQSLAIEVMDPLMIKTPPRAKDEMILTSELGNRIMRSAILMVAGTLFVFFSHLDADYAVTDYTRTMTFTCFVFFDMWNALASRSSTRTLREIGFFSNQALNASIFACLIGHLVSINVFFFQQIFKTQSLALYDLGKLAFFTSSVFLVEEVRKRYRSPRYDDAMDMV